MNLTTALLARCRPAGWWSLLAGLLALSRPAGAQTALPSPLTLPQALAAARTNYPLLRARQASVQAAQADVRTQRANYLPQVNAQLQAVDATVNQVRGAFIGGVAIPISGGIKTTPYNDQTAFTSLGALSIEWPAVTFGRYRADEVRSQAVVSAAQADYDQAVFEHQTQVADAYLLALGADKSVALQRANLARAQALGRVIRAGAASGIRPGIDSATVNAEISSARLQLLASRQRAQQQHTRLAGLLGTPTQAVAIDSMQFYTKLPQAPPLPAVLDTARLNPLLQAYHQRVVANAAYTKLLLTNKRPTFSLLGSTWARGSGVNDRANEDGSFNINSSPGAGLPFKAYDFMVGATLTWHLTELLHSGYAAQAQRLRTVESQAVYSQQALQLQTEQQNATLQLELAAETARQAPVQLSAARQAYRQARARYDAGLDNLLVLTQATAVLNRAETDQALATNNLWRALLLRAATTGDLKPLLGQL